MKLLTKAIKKQLDKTNDPKWVNKYADSDPADLPIICKLFDPTGRYTLFVTDGQETADGYGYYLFGYVLSPITPDFDEWGSVYERELEGVKGKFGLGIERDRWFNSGTTLRELFPDKFGVPL